MSPWQIATCRTASPERFHQEWLSSYGLRLLRVWQRTGRGDSLPGRRFQRIWLDLRHLQPEHGPALVIQPLDFQEQLASHHTPHLVGQCDHRFGRGLLCPTLTLQPLPVNIKQFRLGHR